MGFIPNGVIFIYLLFAFPPAFVDWFIVECVNSNSLCSGNIAEALNQGETVDLDALMADLCSIEQELSSIGAGNTKRQITETKATQKLPASRHTSKHGTLKGLSSSSNRITKPSHANYSLDDITAQLEQASLSMDEAAQQSVLEDTKPLVTNQHRRTASAGTVSDAEVHSISNSSRSSITSATSSMDSLDIDKVARPQELDLTHQGQPITEVSGWNFLPVTSVLRRQWYLFHPVLINFLVFFLHLKFIRNTSELRFKIRL